MKPTWVMTDEEKKKKHKTSIQDKTKPNIFVKPDSPVSGKNKRKKKQSISDNEKDGKYWERRRKNNAAAKRSREERLAKEASVAKQANALVLENQKLTEDLKNALNENKKLKLRLKKYEPNFSI